jgi:hypothetical protein
MRPSLLCGSLVWLAALFVGAETTEGYVGVQLLDNGNGQWGLEPKNRNQDVGEDAVATATLTAGMAAKLRRTFHATVAGIHPGHARHPHTPPG